MSKKYEMFISYTIIPLIDKYNRDINMLINLHTNNTPVYSIAELNSELLRQDHIQDSIEKSDFWKCSSNPDKIKENKLKGISMDSLISSAHSFYFLCKDRDIAYAKYKYMVKINAHVGGGLITIDEAISSYDNNINKIRDELISEYKEAENKAIKEIEAIYQQS